MRAQGGRQTDIRTFPAIVLGSLLALCLPLAGCGNDGNGTPNTSDYRLSGRVLDADTGEEVSRETLYLHFFSDDVKLKKTLNPEPGSRYEVLMPQAKVRVRVSDKERRYALFEETIDLASKAESYDIKLKPTNYIRLHGTVKEDGKPVPPSDGTPGDRVMLYFESDGKPIAGPIPPASDGTYSLRVPRGPIKILTVNTAKKPKNDTVDLTGNTNDSHAFDIELE